jgi:hypothetical protein
MLPPGKKLTLGLLTTITLEVVFFRTAFAICICGSKDYLI